MLRTLFIFLKGTNNNEIFDEEEKEIIIKKEEFERIVSKSKHFDEKTKVHQ